MAQQSATTLLGRSRDGGKSWESSSIPCPASLCSSCTIFVEGFGVAASLSGARLPKRVQVVLNSTCPHSFGGIVTSVEPELDLRPKAVAAAPGSEDECVGGCVESLFRVLSKAPQV